jgi:hypothetical protein
MIHHNPSNTEVDRVGSAMPAGIHPSDTSVAPFSIGKLNDRNPLASG